MAIVASLPPRSGEKKEMKLFWTCFVARAISSFGSILQALTLPQWGSDFNLTNTQIGDIPCMGPTDRKYNLFGEYQQKEFKYGPKEN